LLVKRIKPYNSFTTQNLPIPSNSLLLQTPKSNRTLGPFQSYRTFTPIKSRHYWRAIAIHNSHQNNTLFVSESLFPLFSDSDLWFRSPISVTRLSNPSLAIRSDSNFPTNTRNHRSWILSIQEYFWGNQLNPSNRINITLFVQCVCRCSFFMLNL